MLVRNNVINLYVVEVCRCSRQTPVDNITREALVSRREYGKYICHHVAGGEGWVIRQNITRDRIMCRRVVKLVGGLPAGRVFVVTDTAGESRLA